MTQELAALEEGLEAEAQAIAELRAALTVAGDGKCKPKEAYVQLKMALQSAHQKSRGLRSDLQASINAAEEALQACLVGNGMSPSLAKVRKHRLGRVTLDRQPMAIPVPRSCAPLLWAPTHLDTRRPHA